MSSSVTPARPQWWQWLTVLSLDAPLVALLWQALFARLAGVSLAWHDPVLLGLAVWIIYAADRWIEGWRLAPEIVQTQRHHFYIRQRWPVFALGLGAILAGAVIAITRLESREFKAGFVLLIPTLLYLFHQLVHRHHRLRVPKEVCIAVIFALGCVLSPAARAPESIPLLVMPVILFGLLCLTDCALISAWEKEVDARHGQTSLALQWKRGVTFIRVLPWLLSGAGFISLVVCPAPIRPAVVCVALSGLLLGWLDAMQPRLGRRGARALVDLTLMTPALVIFLR